MDIQIKDGGKVVCTGVMGLGEVNQLVGQLCGLVDKGASQLTLDVVKLELVDGMDTRKLTTTMRTALGSRVELQIVFEKACATSFKIADLPTDFV